MADTAKNADFIGKVVTDAKEPPETRMLTGWFGDSGEDGFRRLYTDAELSSYVDIPADAILYTEPIRDSQPAGAVLVWIKADAALQQGGSAFSRAARFLQGQVTADFGGGAGAAAAAASDDAGSAEPLQKAGYRCVTQVPCGEVTGFTGKCTNQPEVGGAWPCITAAPHCFEVTGFTGKCTHQPWPNPTQYIGCTIYHCPTNDLTHNPHICNIVVTGLPGCGVNPPDKGGDPAAKVAADDKDAAAVPVTSLPGCGYTKTWGLCNTQLLGCPQTKDCPTSPPGCGLTRDCPTTAPGCGFSNNPICTNLPGCGFTKNFGACQPTLPPKCHVSIDNPCITQTEMGPQCGPGTIAAFGAAVGQIPVNAPVTQICATVHACTVLCRLHTTDPICHLTHLCTPLCPTRVQPQCFPVPSPFCPVTPGCPFGPGPVITPNVRGGGGARFGAPAADPTRHPIDPDTVFAIQCNPSAVDACPTRLGCDTQPPTELCTQIAEACQTNCGPLCQTQQPNCTQVNCTQAGPLCPSIGIVCTVQPQCPIPTPQLDCTFTVTQGIGCPFSNPQNCTITIDVANPIDLQQVGAAAAFPHTAGPTICTQIGPGCPPTAINACTQLCTILGPNCGGVGANAAAQPAITQTLATVCTQVGCQIGVTGFQGCGVVPGPGTQFGPQCPPTHLLGCTQFGPQCHLNTAATVCTQVHQCQIGITGFQGCGIEQGPVTQFGPGCPPSQLLGCTQFGPQCHLNTAATVCTQVHQCQIGQTGFQGCGAEQVGAANTLQPCTNGGPNCNTQQPGCTHYGPACPPHAGAAFAQQAAIPPSLATVCTQIGPQCLHTIQGPACPVTVGGPHCPVHTGFNCPSAIGCQSVACQTIACQPGGGGGQQQFGARAIGVTPNQPTPATHCFICNPPTIGDDPLARAAAGTVHPTLLTQPVLQCNPSIVDACPTRLCTHQIYQCQPSLIDACPTRLIIQCNPSAIDACPTRAGCPTQNPAQCPPHSGFVCPSQAVCPSIACQSIACNPGGGVQRFGAAAFDQSTEFCPTSGGCGGVAQPQAVGAFQTSFVNCFNQPTPATRCFICPPITSFPRCAVY